MDDRDPPLAGTGALNLTFIGTAALVVSSTAAALAPDSFGLAHAVLSCALFAVGTGAMLWAYALGVTRSRTEAVTLAGLFFLSGDVAPAGIRRPFRTALAVEVVAVVAAASARPYTNVAFGVLAPMFALGLMSAWSGRYGTFPPRPPKAGGRATVAPEAAAGPASSEDRPPA